jgi:hypothetical protein
MYHIILFVCLSFLNQETLKGMMGIGAPGNEDNSGLMGAGGSGLMGIGGGSTFSSNQQPLPPAQTNQIPQTPSKKQPAATAQSTTTAETPLTEGQTLFNQLYTNLEKYQTQLEDMFSYYKTFTSSSDDQPAAPNTYLKMAFMPGSYPLMLLDSMRATILEYIQGRTQQLNSHFYANNDANDFITFKTLASKTESTNTSGQLAELNKIWDAAVATFESEFKFVQNSTASGSSQEAAQVSFLQKNYENIVANYSVQRDQMLVSWIYNLVNQLAKQYNEKNFTAGVYNFQIVPDSSALLVYQTVFDNALDSLVQNSSTLAIGNFGLNTAQSSSQQNSVQIGIVDKPMTYYNTPSQFKQAVQNDMSSKLGSIGAYSGNVIFQKAVKLAENKKIPNQINQSDFTYGQVQSINLEIGYGTQQGEPTGGASATLQEYLSGQSVRVTPETITAQPQFEEQIESFLSTTAQLQAIIQAFEFEKNNNDLWMSLE